MIRKITKKLQLSSVFLILCAINASAQVSIRVDLGMPVYQETSFDPIDYHNAYGLGLQAGVDYDFHIKGKFYITPGANWSFHAVDATSADSNDMGKETMMFHNLNIPVHFKWIFNIRPERFAIYIFGGPALSVGLSSKSLFDAEFSGVSVNGTYDYFSGKTNFKYGGLQNSSQKELFDSKLQSYFDEAGIRHKRLDVHFEVGVGFRFKDHYELVLGFDDSFLNKYAGYYSKSYTLSSAQLYLGFRYRFAKKN